MKHCFICHSKLIKRRYVRAKRVTNVQHFAKGKLAVRVYSMEENVLSRLNKNFFIERKAMIYAQHYQNKVLQRIVEESKRFTFKENFFFAKIPHQAVLQI